MPEGGFAKWGSHWSCCFHPQLPEMCALQVLGRGNGPEGRGLSSLCASLYTMEKNNNSWENRPEGRERCIILPQVVFALTMGRKIFCFPPLGTSSSVRMGAEGLILPGPCPQAAESYITRTQGYLVAAKVLSGCSPCEYINNLRDSEFLICLKSFLLQIINQCYNIIILLHNTDFILNSSNHTLINAADLW